MRPWTVDADDIKIAEDFDDALLHQPWIDGFLNAGDAMISPNCVAALPDPSPQAAEPLPHATACQRESSPHATAHR